MGVPAGAGVASAPAAAPLLLVFSLGVGSAVAVLVGWSPPTPSMGSLVGTHAAISSVAAQIAVTEEMGRVRMHTPIGVNKTGLPITFLLIGNYNDAWDTK